VDAVVQVVRCFDDKDVVHVSDTLDPVADIETIATELVLADLESLGKQKERLEKLARGGQKEAKAKSALAVAEKLVAHLDAGRPALTLDLTEEERAAARGFFLLTMKPTLFACNVAEADLAHADDLPLVAKVRAWAEAHSGSEAVAISAKIEAELGELSPEDAREYLASHGVDESGVGRLIRAAYHLLGLRTYLTAGEKEARAWTIHAGDTAPQAAGVIHTGFREGLHQGGDRRVRRPHVKQGSMAAAREAGVVRQEGRDYVVKDGDVMLFKFNV
jgi:GTP-binding protein YchF